MSPVGKPTTRRSAAPTLRPAPGGPSTSTAWTSRFGHDRSGGQFPPAWSSSQLEVSVTIVARRTSERRTGGARSQGTAAPQQERQGRLFAQRCISKRKDVQTVTCRALRDSPFILPSYSLRLTNSLSEPRAKKGERRSRRRSPGTRSTGHRARSNVSEASP